MKNLLNYANHYHQDLTMCAQTALKAAQQDRELDQDKYGSNITRYDFNTTEYDYKHN